MKKIILLVATVFSTFAFSQTEKNTSNKTKVGLIAEIMTGNELKLKTNSNYKFKDKEAVYITEPDSDPKGKMANITAKGYYYYDASNDKWFKIENLPYRPYDSSIQESNNKLK
jgi:hypothetical protein